MQKDYPRPQLARENWVNLNGTWQFRFDDAREGERGLWYERGLGECGSIEVPFTYETAASGIKEEAFHPVVWYQRPMNHSASGKRTLLHFEGVDYKAKVWINGRFAGEHVGAYARFSLDITELLVDGENRITVRAEDSDSCAQPRGKQRWKKENFACWYVQATGIWKTVWCEDVEQDFIESAKITPSVDTASVGFAIQLNKSMLEKELALHCRIRLEDRVVADYSLQSGAEYVEFEVGLAGKGEPWEIELWSPESPKLYEVELTLGDGQAVDKASSYFGMRKISCEGGQVMLNNKPVYQRLILDQGYWEESGLTPPSGEALVRDIDLILEAGYNGLRKHQKVEDERFLYWCDRKGLLVWCEMPSTYVFRDEAVDCFTRQWMEIVEQNYSHPCIITWTAFNESWGVERILTDKRQQAFTEGIYHLTKALDPMRPVIVNDGWEHTVSDIVTLHDYEEDGQELARRYGDKEPIVENRTVFNGDRFAFAQGYQYKGQPVLLSEYGGIAFKAEEGWGYGKQVASEEEFLARFEGVTRAVKETGYMTGFCYTQLTDVQQEVNGLYTMQREPKVDIKEVRRINLS